eukprot:8948172-Alexandrium_andersonii.AAC.1
MDCCFLAKHARDKTLTGRVFRDRDSRARSWRAQCCAKAVCATTQSTRPSPAPGGSGAIVGSC